VSREAESSHEQEPAHPRETTMLYGHEATERALLDAYRSGHLGHAFLIGGPPGTGKATLAYRVARFILAHPDPAAPSVQSATSLFVPPEHPVARRIAGQAQADLLVLVRTINEKTGKLRQDIVVEDVRKTITFFGSTPGQGGWRIALVDCVDELNTNGANALLKILEEPPRKALLLLVSHSAARVLPTIRSRCRSLFLRPLSGGDVVRAIAAATHREEGDPEIARAAGLAEGSIRRALALLSGHTLELHERIVDILKRLPVLDRQALHSLGDRLHAADLASLEAFVDVVNGWLAERLRSGEEARKRLDRLARIWQEFNEAARDTETFNLERKPLVFNVFTALAEAARAC
jgi:DNA polymerase-3 subunit delta'